MIDEQLDKALKLYKSRLTVLEGVVVQPSKEQILDVLLARDEVQAALNKSDPNATASLMMIDELDDRLKQQTDVIHQQINLADWRTLKNSKAESWWWFLQSSNQQTGQFDWLLSALSISFLTISLGLVTNIAPRFMVGGPDVFGAVAVIGQSVVTLLAVGGVLTKAGQEGVERLLTCWKRPKRQWQAISCGVSFGLLLGLIGFRLLLPQIAVLYNQRGLESYQKGQWTSAQSNYLRSLQLNPDYGAAHFHLGVLYEDLQEFDKARSEYRLALQAGDNRAYNNLARSFILDKKYSMAIPLLLQGREFAKNDRELQYTLLKNLGWVRLAQSRYPAAEGYLLDAVELTGDRAPAHCLLAQVLDKQKRHKEALQEWESCLRYASSSLPDEDEWIWQAKQRLKAKGVK